MMRGPAVSIGLPVYNGADYLATALDSLLDQDFDDLELVISDNASTDGTRDICEDYARRDARVRYSRNERNLGWLANFTRVLELATAERFMWASHDDVWSPSYVARLARGFSAGSDVMLVAGRTAYVTADGAPHKLGSAGAPPSDVRPRVDVAVQLLEEHATSWFFGMYDRAKLRATIPALLTMPEWGGDLLFLLRCCLRYDVAGDDDAVIYKRVRASRFQPSTPDAKRIWQRDFTRGVLGEIASAPLSVGDKAQIARVVPRYLWRIVVNEGQPRSVGQWARRALRKPAGAVRRELARHLVRKVTR